MKKNNKEGKSVEKKQEISKSNLNNKLKELSNELTEKNKQCEKLKEELDELKKEHSNQIQIMKKFETEAQKTESKVGQEKLITQNDIEIEEVNKKENNENDKENIKDNENRNQNEIKQDVKKSEKKGCIIF